MKVSVTPVRLVALSTKGDDPTALFANPSSPLGSTERM
jgi:hypothetical protein